MWIHGCQHFMNIRCSSYRIWIHGCQLFIIWNINSWLTTYQISTLDCQHSTSENASWGEKLWETQKAWMRRSNAESPTQIQKSSWHRNIAENIDFSFFCVFLSVWYEIGVFWMFLLFFETWSSLSCDGIFPRRSSTPPRTLLEHGLSSSMIPRPPSMPPRRLLDHECPERSQCEQACDFLLKTLTWHYFQAKHVFFK